jgi:hypothetical protein
MIPYIKVVPLRWPPVPCLAFSTCHPGAVARYGSGGSSKPGSISACCVAQMNSSQVVVDATKVSVAVGGRITLLVSMDKIEKRRKEKIKQNLTYSDSRCDSSSNGDGSNNCGCRGCSYCSLLKKKRKK